MAFRILGLPAEKFTHLFALSDAELAAQGGVRRTVDGKYPCRVSLTDFGAGRGAVADQLRTSSGRFALPDAVCDFCARRRSDLRQGERDPEQLRSRMLAVRSFDSKGMMVDNCLADGKEIEPVLEDFLAPSHVDYLHIHFAAAGCYAARVERA